MYFLDIESRSMMELAPGVHARTFWGDQMLMSLVDLEPGAEVPEHSHPHEQVGVVLEGDLELEIDGEVRLMRPGAMYIIPGGTTHRARAVGGGVRVMDVFHPVREEYRY